MLLPFAQLVPIAKYILHPNPEKEELAGETDNNTVGATWGHLSALLQAPGDAEGKESKGGRGCAQTCMIMKPDHSLPFQALTLTLQVLAVGLKPEHTQHCGPG